MPKKVLIANEIMADGEVRAGGKIHSLSDATADYLVASGKGRIPTDEETARLGVVVDKPVVVGKVVNAPEVGGK